MQEFIANLYPTHQCWHLCSCPGKCEPAYPKFPFCARCVLCKWLIFQIRSEIVLAPSHLKVNTFLLEPRTVRLKFNIQISQKIWEAFHVMPAQLVNFQVSCLIELVKRGTAGASFWNHAQSCRALAPIILWAFSTRSFWRIEESLKLECRTNQQRQADQMQSLCLLYLLRSKTASDLQTSDFMVRD